MNLLKRLVVVCLATSLLVGCGGKPRNISEDMYELGLKALEITEDYLATDLNIEEAYDKMSDVLMRTVVEEKYEMDGLIQSGISTINSKMKTASLYPEECEEAKIQEIRERKEILAERLGK